MRSKTHRSKTLHSNNQRSTTRRPTNRVIAAAAAITALGLASGCANDVTTSAPPPDLRNAKLVAALTPFDQCDALLSKVKAEAMSRVGAYGFESGPVYRVGRGGPVAMEDKSTLVPSAAGAAPASMPDSSAPDSATNNQEAGVDEADLIKSDGHRIVTVQGNELKVVILVDGVPKLESSVPLGDVYADRLFLRGDTAYVLATSSGGVTTGAAGAESAPIPVPASGATSGSVSVASPSAVSGSAPSSGPSPEPPVVSAPEPMPPAPSTPPTPRSTPGATVIEVTLGGRPHVIGSTTIDGQITDGRLANGAIRLVVTSSPAVSRKFVMPQSPDGEQQAKQANRGAISSSTLADWIPTQTPSGAAPRPLIACDQLYQPAEFSGFDTLSVVTITDGLGSLTATGVLADGGIAYASDSHLFVATNRWVDLPPPAGTTPTVTNDPTASNTATAPTEHTDLHSFSISGTAPATYLASGRVDGHLLNQYSMSESGGRLRVATTVDTTVAAAPCPKGVMCVGPQLRPAPSDSRVAVLEQHDRSLVTVGSIGGLGVGEQIRSVRFIGDTAYVVTFRRTDPFHVIDLSDPAHPRLAGELELPGFSTYLHPVGPHLVLGAGSDTDEAGRVNGSKLTLFDTTDPTAPRVVGSWTSPSLSFAVDGDPHAFAWDATDHRAYLPYYGRYGNCIDTSSGCTQPSAPGVLVVNVDGSGIAEAGRIAAVAAAGDVYGGQVSRAFVVGDRVITRSTSAVAANDRSSLAPTGFVSL